jgi:hypothetical protein
MWAKSKDSLRRAGEIVAAVFLLWIVLGSIISWIFGLDDGQYHPRYGEPCGPGHRWTYVRINVTDPDLSCEPETLP